VNTGAPPSTGLHRSPLPAPRVIALDGPSASGKSSTAAAVARAIGWVHLDSGSLYRGQTRVALDLAGGDTLPPQGLDPAKILQECERRQLALQVENGQASVWLDDRPAEDRIRAAPVTAAVSAVSAMAPLREWVNWRLRAVAQAGQGVVADGRDIGTVVFPGAPLKVYLTASPETRAMRRLLQRGEGFDSGQLATETALLAARDEADSRRAVAPLRKADDALPLDGTSLTFEQQVEWIVARARERGLAG
jgi:cytidylate kinase